MPVRYSAVLLGVVLVGSLLLVGCGQSVGEGGNGGSGGTDPDPEFASVEMYVFDWSALPLNLTPAAGGSSSPREVPLEGVKVCQLDADNCVTTDSEGLTEIFFPRDGKEIAFTIVHEGYGRWVVSNVIDERFPELFGSPVRFPLYTHEYLEAIAAQVEVSYPWEKGMAALGRWAPQGEVKFIPVGPTADEVGAAFYFDDDTLRYSLEADATGIITGINDFPLAQGGFAEVAPGVHQFELSVEAGHCTQASWGWPGDAPNRLRIPVLAGYTTYGSMRCGESPF
jgi:hypothetical protein